MGTTLFLQTNYKEAIPFFEKAFKNSDNYDVSLGYAYKLLSISYEKTGNFQKALEYYKISAEASDSVRKKENIRKATELSMNYDFDKKEQVRKAEQKLKDNIAKSKQTALLVGLAIFLLLAIAAFVGFKNKQKANRLLKIQKRQIESTLVKLKSAQAQLVQSKKMASLGELTAGIAHEIQNPLNFVNNFSEVNRELIAEMRDELAKGNYDEVKSIALDIESNEEKINHHGKRAGGIVKGMLQHSQSKAAQKESTDINALVDEYLRLSYHGLRAKDKSFNATFHAHPDQNIGKVTIVQQDIGRVLLNLFNNAFYAVREKQANQLIDHSGLQEKYEPTVLVSTKRTTDPTGAHSIGIRVKDNGNGIPHNILDKIFQPFFTTKPTGKGTGLGLSLSYDIVKAHGGTIRVESIENEGTEFILELPE